MTNPSKVSFWSGTIYKIRVLDVAVSRALSSSDGV